MRIPPGFWALALLAACGADRGDPPTLASASKEADVSLSLGSLDSTTSELVPPAEEITPYAHKSLVGKLGEGVDPADLEPLVQKAMTCEEHEHPVEYINEPRALELGRAIRNGNDLRIGGQTLVDYGPITVNGVLGTHDAAFFYFGVFKKLDLDIVYVTLPEDEEYQLLDAVTGTIVSVEGLPVASPTGRFLVAFGHDAMNFLGINIVERSKSGLTNEKAIKTVAYPCGLKWLSDTKAMFQELKPSALSERIHGPWRKDIKGRYGPAYIELRDGDWVYTPASD